MRARWWLGLIASQFVFGACALTTDLDGFSSGGIGAQAEGGTGATPEGGGATLPDGAPKPIAEAGVEAGGPTYGDLIAVDHPVAYFPFDEPAGSPVITEKISGKNATAKKSDYTPGVPGIAGLALGATGNGELDFGDNLDVVGKNPWTIEAWIKPEFEPGDKVFYEYINKRYNGSNGLVAYVRHENDGTTMQVEQSYGGAGRGVSGDVKAFDHFLHVVFVYDPEKTGLRVWIDGKHGDKGYDDNGGPTDNPQSVYIASGVRGAIDEMALYDYALPDDRILAHFAAGKQP